MEGRQRMFDVIVFGYSYTAVSVTKVIGRVTELPRRRSRHHELSSLLELMRPDSTILGIRRMGECQEILLTYTKTGG